MSFQSNVLYFWSVCALSAQHWFWPQWTSGDSKSCEQASEKNGICGGVPGKACFTTTKIFKCFPKVAILHSTHEATIFWQFGSDVSQKATIMHSKRRGKDFSPQQVFRGTVVLIYMHKIHRALIKHSTISQSRKGLDYFTVHVFIGSEKFGCFHSTSANKKIFGIIDAWEIYEEGVTEATRKWSDASAMR